MRVWSGMILILASLITGCAPAATTAGGGGGGGALTSPTGRQYERGTPPRQTRFSQAALLAVAQGRFEQGLQEARSGIAADSANPIHYYYAGEAAAGLGNYALADSMWTVAERIHPAYELEVEPAREKAWVTAFNAGVEAYNAGNQQAAMDHWSKAHSIYKLRPDAAQYLALVLTQAGRYPDAIRTYREGLANLDLEPATRVVEAEEAEARVEARTAMTGSLIELLIVTGSLPDAETLLRQQLQTDPSNIELQASLANVLVRQNRAAEANEIYGRLLTMPGVPPAELFNIGVSLFEAEQFTRSAEAFARVLQAWPNSRDAAYNQLNALYAAKAWAELPPVVERLNRLDPLNSTGSLMLAGAYREMNNNQGASQTIAALERLPVFIDQLQLAPSANETRLTGSVLGNRAAAGSQIRLRFTFYDDQGATLGTQTVAVTAPAYEARGSFEVTFNQPAAAYSYQVEQ